MSHLSPLRIDAARAGEETDDERAHLERCDECREAVQSLQAFAAELKRFGAFPGRVPSSVDRAILRKPMARIWYAAAAVLALAFGLMLVLPAPGEAADIDGNGVVDVLDAYLLAGRLPAGRDVNADGVVDMGDVDAVLRRCVSVSRGSIRQDEAQFAAVDVYIDAGDTSLAAWQFELSCSAKLVGVEGGDSKVYSDPPYYDPEALQGGRIIAAAFTTDANPPKGRVRVARLHMMEQGKAEYSVKLIAAAAPGGARIDAKIEAVRVGGPK